jgi:hypothetical protein
MRPCYKCKTKEFFFSFRSKYYNKLNKTAADLTRHSRGWNLTITPEMTSTVGMLLYLYITGEGINLQNYESWLPNNKA